MRFLIILVALLFSSLSYAKKNDNSFLYNPNLVKAVPTTVCLPQKMASCKMVMGQWAAMVYMNSHSKQFTKLIMLKVAKKIEDEQHIDQEEAIKWASNHRSQLRSMIVTTRDGFRDQLARAFISHGVATNTGKDFP